MVRTEERKYKNKNEEREDRNEERKSLSKTWVRRTVPSTPSSWWEERKKIVQPSPQDQEKSYRGEQERYKQERDESEKQRRAEVEGKNKTWTRINIPTTPSSWWEDRKKIEQPDPQDQEKRYREEQERYKHERDESEKQIRAEVEGKNKTWARINVPSTPSSWWEDRKKIEQPNPQDQEKRYREEQERYKQERDESEKQMRVESKEKKDTNKETFENSTGIPDIYSETFEQVSNLWKDSYAKLYVPYIDSMLKLSLKSAEIFRGNASPEACTEFHTLWMNTYQETFGRLFDNQSMQPSKEVLEYIVQSENINLTLFKSWIAALEKMSQRAEELSKQSAGPKTNKYFYNPWAKIYADTFNSMSNIWVKSYNTLTETV